MRNIMDKATEKKILSTYDWDSIERLFAVAISQSDESHYHLITPEMAKLTKIAMDDYLDSHMYQSLNAGEFTPYPN